MNESFKHCKPIGAAGDGVRVIEASSVTGVTLATGTDGNVSDFGVVTCGSDADHADFAGQFASAIAAHRHWDRETLDMVPA